MRELFRSTTERSGATAAHAIFKDRLLVSAPRAKGNARSAENRPRLRRAGLQQHDDAVVLRVVLRAPAHAADQAELLKAGTATPRG